MYYFWPMVTGGIAVVTLIIFVYTFFKDTDYMRMNAKGSKYLIPNVTLLMLVFAWAAIALLLFLNIQAQLAL